MHMAAKPPDEEHPYGHATDPLSLALTRRGAALPAHLGCRQRVLPFSRLGNGDKAPPRAVASSTASADDERREEEASRSAERYCDTPAWKKGAFYGAAASVVCGWARVCV